MSCSKQRWSLLAASSFTLSDQSNSFATELPSPTSSILASIPASLTEFCAFATAPSPAAGSTCPPFSRRLVLASVPPPLRFPPLARRFLKTPSLVLLKYHPGTEQIRNRLWFRAAPTEY